MGWITSAKPSSADPLLRALVVIVCMGMFAMYAKVYDLFTALTFAVALGSLARQQWSIYGLWFVLGCLNRETTIYLIPIFAVHTWTLLSRPAWWLGVFLQVFVALTVRLFLMGLYADHPGTALLWRPVENLQRFYDPLYALGHGVGVLLLLGICFRDWKRRPRLLRLAFLVLFPVLCVAYLLFGWPGEIRVFWEIVPVVYGLGVMESPRSRGDTSTRYGRNARSEVMSLLQ